MTKDEWVAWVVDAARRGGIILPHLRDRLLESVQADSPEDIVQRAIQAPTGTLSPAQRQLVSELHEVVIAELLSTAEKGLLFGALDRVFEKYGERIDSVLKQGSEEFTRLAHTFVTFDTELDDLAHADRSLLLYHLLKEVELSIRGLFFPSAGPFRVPVADRVKAMREILALYAPSLNTEAFYSDNPVLRSERSSAGCFGVALLGILVLFLIAWGIGA